MCCCDDGVCFALVCVWRCVVVLCVCFLWKCVVAMCVCVASCVCLFVVEMCCCDVFFVCICFDAEMRCCDVCLFFAFVLWGDVLL